MDVKYTFKDGVLDILEWPDLFHRSFISVCNVDHNSVKEIRLPEGVKKLSDRAFEGFLYLEKVKLPSTLERIGERCFSMCHSLEEIEIPDGVCKLGNKAFIDCQKLKKIKLPSSLKCIRESCFYNCLSLQEIEIPEGVETLEAFAFNWCGIKRIKLPSTLKNIDKSCFNYCNKLEEIVIPEGIEKLNSGTFVGCWSMKNIKLPSTLKSIGNNCFSMCYSLKEINLPEGLKEILSGAFKDCTGLIKMEIPDTVEHIESDTFNDCYNLKEVKLPSYLEIICNSCFSGCSSLEKVEIPKQVERIDRFAFSDCSSLGVIDIPKYCMISCQAFTDAKVKTLKVDESKVWVDGSSLVKAKVENLVYKCNDKEVSVDVKNKEIYSIDLFGFVVHNHNDNYFGFCHKEKYLDFNLEKVFKRANEINKIKDLSEYYFPTVCLWSNMNKFLPHYQVVKNMPVDDIDLFYKNNNCNKWAEILRYTPIQSDSNKGTLFKLCYALGVFQESGSKRDEAVEYIKEHILNKMSEDEIHAKFDGLDTFNNKFDPMWAEFFMKYYKDNPDFMVVDDNYLLILGYEYLLWNDPVKIDLLASSYNNFSSVKKTYPNKVVNTNREVDMLLPSHVIDAITTKNYDNVDVGNEEFANTVGKYGYTDEQFKELQKWFNKGKEVTQKDLKLFISEDIIDENNVTYELLNKDNPLGAVLGNITNCCQVIGGAGESCVKYGMTEPNSRFMTFNMNKQIIGQAWVWYDEKTGVVCLDNIEVPTKYLDKINHNKEMQEGFVECLKRMATNFISEMENHGLKVKKVTIGEGYNDIKNLLNKNFKKDNKALGLIGYRGYSDADEEQYIIKKK